MPNTGYDYIIAHYVNGKKVKTMGEFKLYGDAIEAYNKIVAENKVIFPKEYQSFKVKYDSDIVLYGYKGKTIKKFINTKGLYNGVKFDNDRFKLKQINPYKVEEHFIWYHNEGKQRITFKELMTIIDIKSNHFTIKAQLTSNKISFEYFENNKIADLFVLKNTDDADRLFSLLQYTCTMGNITNVMFFYDNDAEEKTKLYDRLVKKLGVNRSYLIRPYTH